MEENSIKSIKQSIEFIWQPRTINGCNFEIKLHRAFAAEMIFSKLSPDNQTKINELGKEELHNSGMGYQTLNYLFHRENSHYTSFIGRIDLENGYSSGLVLDGEFEKNPLHKGGLIKYHSRNVDTPLQAYALTRLFELWIAQSNAKYWKNTSEQSELEQQLQTI